MASFPYPVFDPTPPAGHEDNAPLLNASTAPVPAYGAPPTPMNNSTRGVATAQPAHATPAEQERERRNRLFVIGVCVLLGTLLLLFAGRAINCILYECGDGSTYLGKCTQRGHLITCQGGVVFNATEISAPPS